MHRLDLNVRMDSALNAAVVAPTDPSAPQAASPAHAAPVLAIVVPTFRERDNVAELVRRLDATLGGIPWEVVFVDDDSPDGTADAVRELGRSDPRVRCLHRIGRRGLSSACVEGVLATSAQTIAVMDADLQHDETILPEMLRAIRERGVDIAVGSRYVAGGGIGEWDQGRARISRLATRISRVVVPERLADPMSGFFMVRRDVFMESVRSLSTLGFKILVDLFASSPRALSFVEVPYRFRERHAGESKLDGRVAWDFGMLLLDKMVGRWVPVRFLSFAMIGGLGVIVHMGALTVLFRTGLSGFGTGQAIASAVAMVFNFLLNNALTYRDAKLKGAAKVRGLLVFMLVCGLGAVANVGVADWLFSEQRQGWVVAALAGILVGAVWNYTTSSFYTWGRRGR
ncbi:MAG: glycosyltransferase family 2 protein [Burkholderiaceae bacterium]|jgi:dolichol-phosphate mannosyltransferase|nr:glycosyltransferase family 2 protein [Burkholderiales bacterium]MCZ8339280.1 glycosyltransferase family 2 protein [Burkholderiaceae bacterium]